MRLLIACTAAQLALIAVALGLGFAGLTAWRRYRAWEVMQTFWRLSATNYAPSYDAAETLSSLGEEGVRAVRRELLSHHGSDLIGLQNIVCHMVDYATPSSAGALAGLISDPGVDGHIRSALAYNFLRMGREFAENVEGPLRRALSDPDPHIRGYAAVALWNLGRREGLTEPLVAFLKTHDDHWCFIVIDGATGDSRHERSAKQALREIGPPAIPQLTRAVAEAPGSPNAAEILAALGAEAAPAAPALAKRLRTGWGPFLWESDFELVHDTGETEKVQVWEIWSPQNLEPVEKALIAIGEPAAAAVRTEMEQLPDAPGCRDSRAAFQRILDSVTDTTGREASGKTVTSAVFLHPP